MSELVHLLGGNKKSERGWRCLDETLLAGYADGGLAGRDLERVEAHLAACRYCLDQLAVLAIAPEAVEPVPPGLLARARELPDRRSMALPVWRWSAVAATAACGMLAVSVWLNRPATVDVPVTVAPPAPAVVRPQPPSPAPPVQPQTPARSVRNAGTRPLLPELLAPAPSLPVSRDALEFRWREVAGALFYDIRVVTADGDPMWEERVNGTSVRPPASAQFGAGRKYFVWVRAHLVDGKTVPARAVPFTVAE